MCKYYHYVIKYDKDEFKFKCEINNVTLKKETPSKLILVDGSRKYQVLKTKLDTYIVEKQSMFSTKPNKEKEFFSMALEAEKKYLKKLSKEYDRTYRLIGFLDGSKFCIEKREYINDLIFTSSKRIFTIVLHEADRDIIYPTSFFINDIALL